MQQEQPQHAEYPLVPEAEAEGIAWAFNGPHQSAVKYPFKFPALKPDEIRIKQTYFGLCHTDCHLVNRDWGNMTFPAVPGHEICGKVTQVGADVQGFKEGDLVGYGFIRDNCGNCDHCKQGNEQLCGQSGDNHVMPFPHFGGFATHVQAPAKWAFPIPSSIPQELVPPLLCAGITVYAPLKRLGKPGMEVGIIGIGGLGHMGIKFSAALGLKTSAISTSIEKADEAKSYGATDFIVSSDVAQMNKNKKRFDILLMCAHAGNAEQFQQYFELLKFGGELIVVGLLNKDTDISIPFSSLVQGNRSFVGSLVGSRQENLDMFDFIVKHKIYPTVEVFDFADFQKAYDHLLTGKPKYRCVIKV